MCAWNLAREVEGVYVAFVDFLAEAFAFRGESFGLLRGGFVGAERLLGTAFEGDRLSNGERDAFDFDRRHALRRDYDANIDRVARTIAAAIAHYFDSNIVLDGFKVLWLRIDGPGGV